MFEDGLLEQDRFEHIKAGPRILGGSISGDSDPALYPSADQNSDPGIALTLIVKFVKSSSLSNFKLLSY